MPSKIKKRGADSYLLSVSAGFDAKGKRITHTKTVICTSDREAKKEYARFLVQVEQGQITNSGKMTLNQYFDYWKQNFANNSLAASTMATYEHYFKRINEALGHKRLDKIEPIHLNTFFTNLQEPILRDKEGNSAYLAHASIKKYYALLSIMLNRAVKWNLIPYNPITRIELPRAKRKQRQIYNQEELGRFLVLLENEPLKYQIMILLALTGGLRREEIVALEWQHIDLKENAVSIEQAAVYVPKKGIILKDTKTASSNRKITISAGIISMLKRHKIEQATRQLELGDKWLKDEGHNFIFTTWNGKQAHPHGLNSWLKRFVKNNHLPAVNVHAFRHMSASYLIVQGVDIRTVAGKLGHNNPSTTMDIYAHLVKSAEKETANIMDNFIQDTILKAKKKQA
jgi:integrase